MHFVISLAGWNGSFEIADEFGISGNGIFIFIFTLIDIFASVWLIVGAI